MLRTHALFVVFCIGLCGYYAAVVDIRSHHAAVWRRHEDDDADISRGQLSDMLLDDNCDNAKENLTMDWDGKDDAYICSGKPFKSSEAKPVEITDDNPVSEHVCTSNAIPPYKDRIPTSGPHRPVWPMYGEYRYIPPQRWLHALEHGSIALLYHPCADQEDVDTLRKLLNGCIFRHIITAYNKLTPQHPLALVAWGNSLQLGSADVDTARNFIKEHALVSNVGNHYDGFYNWTLVEHSQYASDKDDSIICPN